MIQFRYTLLEEEAIRYFEMILRSPKETRVPRVMAMMWGPALAVGVMILLKAVASWVAWIAAMIFSGLWILILYPALYQRTCYLVATRKLKENKAIMQPIQLMADSGKIMVNQEEKKVKDYFVYFDLLVIGFEDKTNLVIPERVFEHQESLMKELLSDLARILHQNKKEA